MDSNRIWKIALRILPAAFIFISGMALLYLFMPREISGDSILRPDTPDIVARGKALYAIECASCHGPNGQGQPNWDTQSTESNPLAPPHDSTGHTWQHPDQALFQLTKYGSSDIACRTLNSDAMPEFEKLLSDEDVIAVLSYIKSRWPADIRKRHDRINSMYASYALENVETE